MHNFTDNSDDNTADNQTNKETASWQIQSTNFKKQNAP
jgi:hypothetical protein